MRINAIQQNNFKQGPSFQAKLTSSGEAKKVLDLRLREFYNTCKSSAKHNHFGNKEYCFEDVYNQYKTVFEETTQVIGGKIKLILGKGVNSPLFLTYRNAEGSGLRHRVLVSVSDFLKDKDFDGKKPMMHSVRMTIAKFSDSMAKTAGYTEHNPFHVLMCKLNGKKVGDVFASNASRLRSDDCPLPELKLKPIPPRR